MKPDHDTASTLASVGEANEKIRESDALLRAAIMRSPSGIMIAEVVDGEVLVRHINSAALRIRGIHLAEGVEIVPEEYSTGWVLLRLDGETPVPVEELPLARALFQGEVIEAEPLVGREPCLAQDLWLRER
jgi:hypothetical protein